MRSTHRWGIPDGAKPGPMSDDGFSTPAATMTASIQEI